MAHRILLTGATDGIGRETARKLVALGHEVLLHGRNSEKLASVARELGNDFPGVRIETYQADLARLTEVDSLSQSIAENHDHLDVIINNAGVFATVNPLTSVGFDLRFVVNTIAPYRLTRKLLPLLGNEGRVINLSSAAQAPVNLEAWKERGLFPDGEAYAQSKLALTMWSRGLALAHPHGPTFVAVNPGSLLGSKMVQEAYGMAGKDLTIGADILVRAAIEDNFRNASGLYFDNDSGQLAAPHPDALDDVKVSAMMEFLEQFV